MDSDEEAYVLLLLSDGNLPTGMHSPEFICYHDSFDDFYRFSGSFVASGGLESYVTHGFFTPLPAPAEPGTKAKDKSEYILEFTRDNLSTYARSALPFVSDAHRVVQRAMQTGSIEDALRGLTALDELYESMTLNHIARRASVTQGVALLTLYSKGFSQPTLRFASSTGSNTPENDIPSDAGRATAIVDKLKLTIRREETPGHLPICWGVLTAALGLSLERSQFLHIFLCARGSLSAAVRINIVGPYAAQQLLLHAVRPIVDAEVSNCASLRTGLRYPIPDDEKDTFDETVLTNSGPAMTWPLGEILAGRHDLQHSRVFNS